MQPPTRGHPASNHNTRTFQHSCLGLKRQQDSPPRPGPSWPGDALKPTVPRFSLSPGQSLAILQHMPCFSFLVHSPIGPRPGEIPSVGSRKEWFQRCRALLPTCSARAQHLLPSHWEPGFTLGHS